MESHLDSNQFADLSADLNLERLRSKTTSLAAASRRLLDEVDRSISDITGHVLHASRLRGLGDSSAAFEGAPTPQKLGRSGVPDALKAIFESAQKLKEEVVRVQSIMERYSELLRGTDLGYTARESVSAIGAFAQQLEAVTEGYEHAPDYDLAHLQVVSDSLRSAITNLGSEYSGGVLSGNHRLRGSPY